MKPLFLLLAMGAVCGAAEPDDATIMRVIEASDRGHARRIERFEGLIRDKMKDASSKERAESLKELRKELKEEKESQKLLISTVMPATMSVGDIGKPALGSGEVMNVVSATEVLISVGRGSENEFLIENIGTGNLATGQRIELPKAVEVVGTRDFTTVLGAKRTVMVVRPFDLSPAKAIIAERSQKAKQARDALQAKNKAGR